MTKEPLYYKPGSPIGEIVINQPKKRNAISAAMWSALGDCINQAQSDASAKVIIIRGEGGHFAAGADITEFAEVYKTADSASAYTNTMLNALATLENSTKPTLAKIRGACVGGGCSIALACDFRFASDKAKFGITPGKLGLVYSLADTRRLSTTVGESNAKDLLLSARIIDASEAKSIGLCDRVFNETALDDEVAEYAGQMASLSQWSARATKKMLALASNGLADNAPEATQLMLDAFSGDDFQEGYQAFLEKRKPDFPTK